MADSRGRVSLFGYVPPKAAARWRVCFANRYGITHLRRDRARDENSRRETATRTKEESIGSGARFRNDFGRSVGAGTAQERPRNGPGTEMDGEDRTIEIRGAIGPELIERMVGHAAQR